MYLYQNYCNGNKCVFPSFFPAGLDSPHQHRITLLYIFYMLEGTLKYSINTTRENCFTMKSPTENRIQSMDKEGLIAKSLNYYSLQVQ